MLASTLTALTLFTNGARTTTTNGAAVDLAPYINAYGRQMKAVIIAGVPVTASTLDVKLQENPTSSGAAHADWADISGATFTQLTDSAAVEDIAAHCNGRYLRAVATYGSTATSWTFGVIVLAEKKLW